MGHIVNERPLPHLTECGIPGIGVIPFGVHLCHFYKNRQDLVDSLVPYFVAGLRGKERCLWFAAPPLPVDEAKGELAKAVPGLEAMIRKDQIRIIAAAEWYGNAHLMDTHDAGNVWLQEEEKALAEGYKGLRVAGITSFLTREDWESFMRYEAGVNKALCGRRIVALCNYNGTPRRASDVLDVSRVHHCALDRQDATWELLERGSNLP